MRAHTVGPLPGPPAITDSQNAEITVFRFDYSQDLPSMAEVAAPSVAYKDASL